MVFSGVISENPGVVRVSAVEQPRVNFVDMRKRERNYASGIIDSGDTACGSTREKGRESSRGE